MIQKTSYDKIMEILSECDFDISLNSQPEVSIDEGRRKEKGYFMKSGRAMNIYEDTSNKIKVVMANPGAKQSVALEDLDEDSLKRLSDILPEEAARLKEKKDLYRTIADKVNSYFRILYGSEALETGIRHDVDLNKNLVHVRLKSKEGEFYLRSIGSFTETPEMDPGEIENLIYVKLTAEPKNDAKLIWPDLEDITDESWQNIQAYGDRKIAEMKAGENEHYEITAKADEIRRAMMDSGCDRIEFHDSKAPEVSFQNDEGEGREKLEKLFIVSVENRDDTLYATTENHLNIPAHLMTAESLNETKEYLESRGIVEKKKNMIKR